MRVTYNITRMDRFRGMIHLALRSRANLVLYLLMLLAIGGSEFATLPTPTTVVELVATLAMLKVILLGATVAFVVLTVLSLALSTRYKRDPGVLGEHTIELTEDGLIESTNVNRTEARWAGICKVVRTNKYLLVYLGRSEAHLIPRRAFATEDDCDRFYTFCCVKRDEAEVTPPKLSASSHQRAVEPARPGTAP